MQKPPFWHKNQTNEKGRGVAKPLMAPFSVGTPTPEWAGLGWGWNMIQAGCRVPRSPCRVLHMVLTGC